MVSNRGPSAYKPNALPLGQTAHQNRSLLSTFYIAFFYSIDKRCPEAADSFHTRFPQNSKRKQQQQKQQKILIGCSYSKHFGDSE